MAKKISLLDLINKKANKELVTWITSYDLAFSQAAESAGIDMILVGDSGGMVQLGYSTTNPVTMDEMIGMAQAVHRGAPNTFIIGDMPQGSYEVSDEEAVRNALRFVKEAGCDAIKLEGGERICPRVKAIVNAGILVIGHLGLTPQSTASFGGYKVQGKTVESFMQTLKDAKALQDVGIFALLLEAMPSESAGQIVKHLTIPVYGIGAGNQVDGQLIIMHDLLGLYKAFRPWFAKCFIPLVIDEFRKFITSIVDIQKEGREHRYDGLHLLAQMAIQRYIDEVRAGLFPSEDYCYPIKDEELALLKPWINWIE
jgi:3-methyl-2-oxobutanoate hydroxymethyltransferase